MANGYIGAPAEAGGEAIAALGAKRDHEAIDRL